MSYFEIVWLLEKTNCFPLERQSKVSMNFHYNKKWNIDFEDTKWEVLVEYRGKLTEEASQKLKGS